MKIDTFIKLVKQLHTQSIADDTDPNNIVLDKYTNPFDTVSLSDSVRARKTSNASLIWGDGKTYSATDSNGNTYDAPSCGWQWGSGGRWN